MATPSLTVTGGDNPDEPVSYPTFDGRRVQLTPNNNANSPSQSSIQAQAPPRDMARPKRTDTMETITPFVDAQETLPDSPEQTDQQKQQLRRLHSTVSYNSKMSVPPPGSVLTGKQEHYLKRELISQQTRWEIRELSHPTALRRFGAPIPVRCRRGRARGLGSTTPSLHLCSLRPQLPIPEPGTREGVLAGQASVVPRELCQQAHFRLGGSIRGNEEIETCNKSNQIGRADDGFWNTDSIWI